jgi:hypothetical protein
MDVGHKHLRAVLELGLQFAVMNYRTKPTHDFQADVISSNLINDPICMHGCANPHTGGILVHAELRLRNAHKHVLCTLKKRANIPKISFSESLNIKSFADAFK